MATYYDVAMENKNNDLNDTTAEDDITAKLQNLEMAKDLDIDIIKKYAETSPTAKNCLDAVTKFTEAFDILIQSIFCHTDVAFH